MYTLYYYPKNASCAPHMLLEELGVPYQLSLVDRAVEAQKSAEYLKLNPNGRIPTLKDNDLVIFESAAIILHLVDRHPEAGFAPLPGTAERAHFYLWLVFLTNSLQEAIMDYFYPERMAAGDENAIPAIKKAAEHRFSMFMDVIEQHLSSHGPYFLGETISAADLYLTMICHGAYQQPFAKPPRSYKAISKLLDLVIARPAIIKALADEGTPADAIA